MRQAPVLSAKGYLYNEEFYSRLWNILLIKCISITSSGDMLHIYDIIYVKAGKRFRGG